MGTDIPRRLRGAGLWVVEDHLLVSRSIGHTRWGVIGGGVDPGESADQACVREFREEVGVDVRCERLAMVGDIVIRPGDRIEQDVCFYFVVNEAGGDVTERATVASREEGLEIAWIPLRDLEVAPLVPPTLALMIPPALAGDRTVYATYDCREDPDEPRGTRIWS